MLFIKDIDGKMKMFSLQVAFYINVQVKMDNFESQEEILYCYLQ